MSINSETRPALLRCSPPTRIAPPLVSGRHYLYRGERVRLQRYRHDWLLYFTDRSPEPVFIRTAHLKQDAKLGILREDSSCTENNSQPASTR